MLSSLCRGLKERGHKIKVVSLLPMPDKSFVLDGLQENDIEVESINITKLTLWRLLRLRKIIRDFAPDVIHSHLFHANIVSRLALPKNCKIPLINTVHTMELRPSRQWYFTVDRWTRSRYSIQTAVSKAARDFHAEKIQEKTESMPVVYNGINTPRKVTKENRETIHHEWKLDDYDIVIGSVGRFCPEKGFDLLLKLLPKLGQMLPEDKKLGVVLIGDGEERSHLEAIASAAPENIRVVMPGMIASASWLCGAFDLFVMPSRLEGFGLVLAEAMSHGIPVLVNDIPPLTELMNFYDSGKAVDFTSDSPDELCCAILANAAKPAITPAELPFTSNAMIEGYLNIYKSLTGEDNVE